MTSNTIRLPILTYHSIDPSGSVISTAPELFQRQIEQFAAVGFEFMTLSEALSYLEGRLNPFQRVMALTFDDGFRSVYQHALPVLSSRGIRATVFLVTDYLGMNSRWLEREKSLPSFPLMNTGEVRKLLDNGWELGGHSATHARLTELEDAELERELKSCKTSLDGIAGKALHWFAYPYGVVDLRVKEKVGKLFKGACTTELAFACSLSDRLELERIDMYYLRIPYLCRSLDSRWLSGYLASRRLLRKLQTSVSRYR